MYNDRALLGVLRVLIYSGRVPSGPPRVVSGPRLDCSDPTPRLGFGKILQSGGGGRYLKHSSGLWEVPSRDSSRWV